MRWNKSYGAKWRDEASDLLGGVARALRALLGDLATLVEGSDTGWAIDDAGHPYTPARLARLLAFPEGDVVAALGELRQAGVIVHNIGGEFAGQVGLVGWRVTQEDPNAERMRQRRSNGERTDDEQKVNRPRTKSEQGANCSPACSPDVHAEDRRQKTDLDPPTARAGDTPSLADRLRNTRTLHGMGVAVLSERTGLSPSDIRAFETGAKIPGRDSLRVLARELGDPSLAQVYPPARDPGIVDAVLKAEAEARQRFSQPSTDHRPIDHALRLVYAPGEGPKTLDNWLLCFRRMTEHCDREVERKGSSRSAEFLLLDYLAKPEYRARFLADADLDIRKPQQSQRAPPRRPSGPPPPQNDDLPPIIPGANFCPHRPDGDRAACDHCSLKG